MACSTSVNFYSGVSPTLILAGPNMRVHRSSAGLHWGCLRWLGRTAVCLWECYSLSAFLRHLPPALSNSACHEEPGKKNAGKEEHGCIQEGGVKWKQQKGQNEKKETFKKRAREDQLDRRKCTRLWKEYKRERERERERKEQPPPCSQTFQTNVK